MIPSADSQTSRSPEFVTTAQTPEDVALFPSETQDELEEMLEEVVEENRSPGAVLYVASSDGVWMGSAGEANQENGVIIKPTDRFRIGDLTNLFIAVMCLQLAEEGQLNLNQPIASYLPQEVRDRLPNSDKIRIRHLLSHTSGLPNAYTDEFWEAVRADPTREWTAEEVLEYAYTLESTRMRGTFSYSTTNYLLLGLIIETVTGQPLAEVIHQRIRQPAGLTNTFLERREPISGGFTQGYQDWNEDGTPENITTPLVNGGLGLGDKGLVSNASDLVRFFNALFIEGKLLRPDSLDKMLASSPIGKGDAYGLGISHIVTRWGEAWGHSGKALGFQSAIFYFPAHDLTIVAWLNGGDRQRTDPLEVVEEGLSLILGEPDFR